MDAQRGIRSQRRIDKKFLSKSKCIKIYKQKQSRIEHLQQEIEELKKKYEQIDIQSIKKFDDLPLSQRTRKGLKEANYVVPTEIQKETIGLALQGHDILGAAKTGSGKTLAFVIPLLECLFCAGWSILDGLGVIVITPLRELAYQIFEVLNKVGAYHHFSAALVIGGKDLAKERKVLNKCNIMICTPGRLLQHMHENPLFDAMNLKMLILDEADRILNLKFAKTLNAILDFLPIERQTLLFSATQTKSVKDLARLSLKTPVYVSVHEHAKYSTPERLKQNYLVCEAHSKMNLLWSFIKSHKKQKVLVFMSSCKQVKYAYECICRMRPGTSIMALYGSMHQLRRMRIYDDFCHKNQVVMFATDVAARGLDFPNVTWVVQLDCPEDTNTYIHRAGRTARLQKDGEALLVLLPSEKESMLEDMKNRKIPIEELKVNPQKFHNIERKLQALCARDVNLKNSAQRAFKAYLKNVFLMKNKTIFDVTKINIDLYARSLGLYQVPRLRFLEKYVVGFKYSRNSSTAALNCEDSDSDDELLTAKETQELPAEEEDYESDETSKLKKPLTKAAVAKRILKKKIKANTIIKFNEDGKPIREVCGKVVPIVAPELQTELLEEGYSIEKAKILKEKEEEVDKILYKERIKQKHREERLKMREKKKKEEGSAPQLAASDEDQDGASGSDIDPNNITLSNSASEDEDEQENNSDIFSVTEPSDSESERELQNSRKRKGEFIPQKVKRLKETTIEKAKSSKSGHRSLVDDEQLALHFLNS